MRFDTPEPTIQDVRENKIARKKLREQIARNSAHVVNADIDLRPRWVIEKQKKPPAKVVKEEPKVQSNGGSQPAEAAVALTEEERSLAKLAAAFLTRGDLIEHLKRRAAAYWGVGDLEVLKDTKRRLRPIARTRQTVICVCIDALKMTYTAAGDVFGLDHSTVTSARKALLRDEDFCYTYALLTEEASSIWQLMKKKSPAR